MKKIVGLLLFLLIFRNTFSQVFNDKKSFFCHVENRLAGNNIMSVKIVRTVLILNDTLLREGYGNITYNASEKCSDSIFFLYYDKYLIIDEPFYKEMLECFYKKKQKSSSLNQQFGNCITITFFQVTDPGEQKRTFRVHFPVEWIFSDSLDYCTNNIMKITTVADYNSMGKIAGHEKYSSFDIKNKKKRKMIRKLQKKYVQQYGILLDVANTWKYSLSYK